MSDVSGMQGLLKRSLEARTELLELLDSEGTNCYRLFHGVAEGKPGLTIDRFASVVLVQTFRQPLEPKELIVLSEALECSFGEPFQLVWNHRGPKRREAFEKWHDVLIEVETIGHEMGLGFDVNPRHRGIDPLLFPDFRAGRRRCRAAAEGSTVLNLFAYTCGVGVAAMAGGAKEVWNVDFAASALSIGQENAARNGFDGSSFVRVQEDVLPTLRQLAGLPLQGRGRRRPRSYTRFEKREFDLVVLDPPRWSKSPFGAVDLVRDYQSLFKPAVLATKKGGQMLVTNNVAEVECEDWIELLKRCAEKAGRPLAGVEIIQPEADFPSADNRPPLKIAWLSV